MEKGFFSFGTFNYIYIVSSMPEKVQAEILEKVKVQCEKMDDLFSAYKPDSDIGKINANAGIKPIPVSNETFLLLQTARYFSEESKGAFDITIFPAVGIWGIGHKEQQVPSRREIKKIKQLVRYDMLILNEKKQTAFLRKKGQAIDLGGIAKGYAADCARKELMNSGIRNALLNFGGTIVTIGGRSDGEPWRVGIQNPLEERGVHAGTILLEHGALVTSGVNERFFIKNGIRYHHILDPRTCEPSRSKVLSVTATGGDGVQLDALTTGLFVLGSEKGIALANRMGMEALFLMENGEIIATSGFANGKYQFIR